MKAILNLTPKSKFYHLNGQTFNIEKFCDGYVTIIVDDFSIRFEFDEIFVVDFKEVCDLMHKLHQQLNIEHTKRNLELLENYAFCNCIEFVNYQPK